MKRLWLKAIIAICFLSLLIVGVYSFVIVPKFSVLNQKILDLEQNHAIDITYGDIAFSWKTGPQFTIMSPVIQFKHGDSRLQSKHLKIKPTLGQFLLFSPLQWGASLDSPHFDFSLMDYEKLKSFFSSTGTSRPISFKGKIKNGLFTYLHSLYNQPLIRISKITSQFSYLSNGIAKIVMEGALASDEPNLFLSLKGNLSNQILNELNFDVDLSTIIMNQLDPLFKQRLSNSLLNTNSYLEGRILFNVDDTGNKLKLNEARIPLNSNPYGIESLEQIDLELSFDKNQVSLESVRLKLFDADLSGEGIVYFQPFKSPRIKFKASAQNILLNKLHAPSTPEAPQPFGTLELHLNGSSIIDTHFFDRGIEARGTISTQNMRIDRFNLLWMILSKMQAIPGMPENVISKLPTYYQGVISQPFSNFESTIIPIEVFGKRVDFPAINFKSIGLEIRGYGVLDLNGFGRFDCQLSLSRDLSQHLVNVNSNLRTILNNYGELSFPIVIIQQYGQWKAMPDINYIVSKFTSAYGQNIISNVLQNVV